MQRIIKLLFKWITGAVALLFCYGLVQLLIAKITIAPENTDAQKEIEIFILTNGLHTDLVVPAINNIINWDSIFPFDETKSKDTAVQYVAIGWGDKASYMQPTEWIHLTPRITFNAAFGLGTSALHITFHKQMAIGEQCRSIMITSAQYQKLIEYINTNTKRNAQHKTIKITTNKLYGENDAFYEAYQNYSMLYTCNSWTNTALKMAGQKSCIWTIFAQPIFDNYPLEKENEQNK